jgi:hypothetical protein
MRHSDSFRKIRDAILALEQSDCRRLADLFGSMRDKRPALEAPVVAILALFVELEAVDRARLARWMQTYVNAWGQIPTAAGQRASVAAKQSENP